MYIYIYVHSIYPHMVPFFGLAQLEIFLEPAEAMVVNPNITPNWASIKSPQTIMILEGDHMARWLTMAPKKQQQRIS